MAAAPMPLPLFSLCRTEKLLHGLFHSCVWRRRWGRKGRAERELDWIGPSLPPSLPAMLLRRPTDRMSPAKLKMVPLRETFSFRPDDAACSAHPFFTVLYLEKTLRPIFEKRGKFYLNLCVCEYLWVESQIDTNAYETATELQIRGSEHYYALIPAQTSPKSGYFTYILHTEMAGT